MDMLGKRSITSVSFLEGGQHSWEPMIGKACDKFLFSRLQDFGASDGRPCAGEGTEPEWTKAFC